MGIAISVFGRDSCCSHRRCIFFGEPGISPRGLALWLGAWLILLALLHFRRRWTPPLACALVIAELLLAAQSLPDKDLAPPDVYLGQRFTISQLGALQAGQIAPRPDARHQPALL